MSLSKDNMVLKSCPFCGHKPYLAKQLPYDGYQNESPLYLIGCSHCGVSMKRYDESTVATAWNKRTTDEKSVKKSVKKRVIKYNGLFDCPGCRALIAVADVVDGSPSSRPKYCYNCGQALDWEVEDDA